MPSINAVMTRMFTETERCAQNGANVTSPPALARTTRKISTGSNGTSNVSKGFSFSESERRVSECRA